MQRLVVLIAALAIAAPAAALAAEPQASLPDIEDEVMCEACDVALELATESPQAEQEREYIRTLIARGLTKQQILDQLVDQYGPEILATPGDDGFDLAAWIVPAAAILIAAAAIAIGLRRWRRAGAVAANVATGRPEVSDDEAKRLDEDLARYDL